MAKYKFFDMHMVELTAGDRVEAVSCSGRYGQTRKATGVVKSFDDYGGMYLVLDAGNDFSEAGRERMTFYHGGDTYYMTGAFKYHHGFKALIGKGEHNDFEHGHKFYCKKI